MKLRAPMLIFIAVTGLALGATATRAQVLTPDRVQVALDITDRRIEQASMLVAGSGNDRARIDLDAAVSIQARAKSAFSGSQLGIAMRLTLEARGHAERAIALVRGLPDPDRVQAELERTRDILERAHQRIEECDNDRAHSLMRVALAMQERAGGAANSGRFLAALQLSMGAREHAFRALRLCNLEDNLHDSAEQALRRTDDLISRAQDIVADHGNEQARRALAEATEIQGQATGDFRAGRDEASLRLTQAARAMAHRAIRFSGGR